MLGSPGPVANTQLVEEFVEALCTVAFDRANIERQQGVVSDRLGSDTQFRVLVFLFQN